MSQDGHVAPGRSAHRMTGSPALAVATFGLSTGSQFEAHTHAENQLTWAESGVLAVEATGRTWVLPRTHALWIPAGIPHAIDARTPVNMYGLYLRQPKRWTEPAVVAVDDLLRALIVYLARDNLDAPQRKRAESVLYDQLHPVAVTTLTIPLPTDSRALRVAELLSANPADSRSLTSLGREAGASSRTLARLFLAETGMTFAVWRAQCRLCAALPLLGKGMTVSAVATRVGFANPSAFVAMFRRLTGTTPAAYFRG